MTGCTKTIFDRSTRNILVGRIQMLDANSRAQWGKMTPYQMLKHCTMWDEWVLGKRQFKRVFIGRLFGRMALRQMVKDDRPVKRNMPTVMGLRVNGAGDVGRQKIEWVAQIGEYERYNNDSFMHAFFGKMTREEVGCLAYKHTDHHLRQFGV
jgi:Protein of unknown function (DUF1569)